MIGKYKRLGSRIHVAVYVVKATGNEYIGQLLFALEDFEDFKRIEADWTFEEYERGA